MSNQEEKVSLHARFTRLDMAERMVYGYASTGAVDSYNTIFEPAWWPHAIEGYKQNRSLSAMHDRPNIGTVPILEVREKGLWIGARVDDLDEWKLVADKTYTGFSIEFFALKSRLEMIDEKEVVVFTEFVLTDITIGGLPANKDAQFQLVGRLQKEKDAPWDFDWSKDAQEIVDLFGFEGLRQATLYVVPDGSLNSIETYKLPIAKVTRGKLTMYRMALNAAMAVINGARIGEEDYSQEEKVVLYSKIKDAYESFGTEAPQLRLEGSIEMSTFGDKVSEIIKKLAGKDVTEEQRKEIVALEERLAEEKKNQTDDSKLAETIEAFEVRLEKLEAEGKKEAKAETTKKATEFLEKVDERLKTLEGIASKSKQPVDKDEKPSAGIRTKEEKAEAASTGMNQFIRASGGVPIPVEGGK